MTERPAWVLIGSTPPVPYCYSTDRALPCGKTGPNERKNVRIIRGLGAVTVAVASVVGLGAWSVPSTQQQAVARSDLRSATVFQGEVPALAAYVRSHPAEYGGLYLDDASMTVYVDLAATASSQAAAGLEHEVASQAAAARMATARAAGRRLALATRVVRYSQRQLDVTMKQIPTRQPWAALIRPLLVSWGPDPRSDTVQVGLTSLSHQAEASAAAAFGGRVSLVRQHRASFSRPRVAQVGRLVHVSRSKLAKIEMMAGRARKSGHVGIAPQPSRLLDTTPYFGGDRIGNVLPQSGGSYVVKECTAGFMWTSPAMSSVGHCGSGTGTLWYQGYVDASSIPNVFYYTGAMGTQYSTQWGNGRPDFSLMNGTPYDPWVYSGLTTANPVDGWFTPYVGQLDVCTDGSFTGENCSGEVAAVSRCFTYRPSGVYVCNQDIVASVNGSTLAVGGDSGGPVYFYDGNNFDGYPTVSASGAISGIIVPSQITMTDINVAISAMNDGTVATVP